MTTLYKVTLEELQELRRSDVLKGVELIARIQDRTYSEQINKLEKLLNRGTINEKPTKY